MIVFWQFGFNPVGCDASCSLAIGMNNLTRGLPQVPLLRVQRYPQTPVYAVWFGYGAYENGHYDVVLR